MIEPHPTQAGRISWQLGTGSELLQGRRTCASAAEAARLRRRAHCRLPSR